MGDEINNVKNNLKSLADSIHNAKVSANWSVITFSDHIDCPGNPEEVTQIRMNGANKWSSNADDCKNVIDSIRLAGGGDENELDVDALMMANSLETRTNARVFYILLTDAPYKIDNSYGVETIDEAIAKTNEKGANVSVITTSRYEHYYTDWVEKTGGIMCDIYGNFSQQLIDSLVPIIFGEVIS